VSLKVKIMTDLEAILHAIDTLPLETVESIRQRIDQRIHAPKQEHEDVEDWITNFHEAIDEFRDGLSEPQLQDIVSNMNIGYISPKELHDLQQIIDWAKDEN